MSRSERRIRNNKIRRANQLRKNTVLTVSTFFLVMILSFTVNGFLSNASNASLENGDVEFKYYKSIVVEKGDTLWSIALDNMSAAYYTDTEAYVEEVMQMNSLPNDRITAGSYLIIPYFSNEFAG